MDILLKSLVMLLVLVGWKTECLSGQSTRQFPSFSSRNFEKKPKIISAVDNSIAEFLIASLPSSRLPLDNEISDKFPRFQRQRGYEEFPPYDPIIDDHPQDASPNYQPKRLLKESQKSSGSSVSIEKVRPAVSFTDTPRSVDGPPALLNRLAHPNPITSRPFRTSTTTSSKTGFVRNPQVQVGSFSIPRRQTFAASSGASAIRETDYGTYSAPRISPKANLEPFYFRSSANTNELNNRNEFNTAETRLNSVKTFPRKDFTRFSGQASAIRNKELTFNTRAGESFDQQQNAFGETVYYVYGPQSSGRSEYSPIFRFQ